MLEENKKTLEQIATLYLGDSWKKENKNTLFRNYILNENNKNLREAYLSAILYRYWPRMERFYYKSKSSTTPEEAYDWLVRAALYTLEKRMWENPNASIYQDPNGPDKVMNIMIKSSRLSHYERTNTQKRKDGVLALSLDALEEEGDFTLPLYEDDSILKIEDPVRSIILNSFNRKDYFTSFMVYNIAFQDVFKKSPHGYVFNQKRLNSLMRRTGDAECLMFSEQFNLPLEDVKTASKTFTGLSNATVYRAIKRNLSILARKEYPHLLKE